MQTISIHCGRRVLVYNCRYSTMRNIVIEKDTCDKNDIDGNHSEGHPTPAFHIDIPHRIIVDLRQSLKDQISKNKIFCSFEIISTKKPGAFYRRLIIDMEEHSPLFYALTWHNEITSTNDNYLPLNLAENFPPNTLLHLAAKSLRRDEVLYILKKALTLGIINVFALRGDLSSQIGDFEYAVDLIAFIREQFGDTFCICVAGYPQTHPESSSKESDLHYLKAKVEAGADFIITQICFESQIFIDFVNDCRKIGIRIPILPGIFAPTSYACLKKMTDVCRLDVPVKIKEDLAQMKDDDQAAREYSVDLVTRIITDVIESKAANGFHLFTLNRPSSIAVICRRVKYFRTKDP